VLADNMYVYIPRVYIYTYYIYMYIYAGAYIYIYLYPDLYSRHKHDARMGRTPCVCKRMYADIQSTHRD
jgi:hypothetical protein